MHKRWWVVLLLAAAAAWVIADGARHGAARGEVQGKVLSAVQVRGKAQPLAGISARGDVKVRALSERRIGADTASPEYHRLLNRCATCHAAPSPDLHRAPQWPQVIDRMHANMRAAGTLGLRSADRDAVLRFLARSAEELQSRRVTPETGP